MSEDDITPPLWLPGPSGRVTKDRVAVRRGATEKDIVVLAEHRLACTLEQWRGINAAVEEGFANLPAPVSVARKDGVVPPSPRGLNLASADVSGIAYGGEPA